MCAHIFGSRCGSFFHNWNAVHSNRNSRAWASLASPDNAHYHVSALAQASEFDVPFTFFSPNRWSIILRYSLWDCLLLKIIGWFRVVYGAHIETISSTKVNSCDKFSRVSVYRSNDACTIVCSSWLDIWYLCRHECILLNLYTWQFFRYREIVIRRFTTIDDIF